MRTIILKEGPLVFLRNILIMEVLAFGFLYIVSFLQNYEMLYKSSVLIGFVRYDIFLIVVFSLFQLVYISLLFLDWYFSHFEITEKEITRKSGLLFRRRKSVPVSNIVSVETYHSPLGRMMHHATIIIHHSSGGKTKIRNIPNIEEHVHTIKQMSHHLSDSSLDQDVSNIIKEGEGIKIEFKESLRFDKRRQVVSKDVEKMVMKTIVAFLNTKGGTLLIGVRDDGQVVGLADDYQTLQKRDRDGFENYLGVLIKNKIGLSFAKYVSLKFEKIDNLDVCLVSVLVSHRPAYFLNEDNKEDFFVRVGNSTQPLSMSEAEDYIKTRWK